MMNLYEKINKVIETLLVIIFSLMVVDVVWQVFSRYIIGKSSSFTEEFARFAMIWLVILGAAYLTGRREHLSMDFLLRNLEGEKLARRLNKIDGFVLLFALVVMVIGGGNLVYTTLYLGQLSSAMQIPLGYVYAIVPVSGLLIIFYSIYNILRTKS